MAVRFIKNKHVVLVPVVMFGALGLVATLAWKSMKPLREKNGFVRVLSSQTTLPLINVSPKNEEIVDIAGVTKTQIYFKTRIPGILLTTDYNLKNKKYINLNIPNKDKIGALFSYIIDSNEIQILAGNLQSVISVKQGENIKIHGFNTGVFSRGVLIGPNSYIFRGFDTSLKTVDQIFIKKNSLTGKVAIENNISEKNNDAGISTDGALRYDSKTHLITYTFYYRNTFMCLDTNLNLKYLGHTIDTINTSQTKIEKVLSGTAITNTTPKRFINSKISVSNGLMFNNSNLKSDNENPEDFERKSVIDVYDIKTGKYKISFYLSNMENEKMTHFKVIDDIVIVLYKKHIATFKLDREFNFD